MTTMKTIGMRQKYHYDFTLQSGRGRQCLHDVFATNVVDVNDVNDVHRKEDDVVDINDVTNCMTM